MRIFASVFRPLLVVGSGVALHLSAQTPSAELARAVRPFIQKNCQSCHNTNLPSGSVDLQQMLAAQGSLVEQRDTWEKVAYVLRSGQMPPKAALQPSSADREAALELISRVVAASPKATGNTVISQEPATPPTGDWLTFSYDPERTGWARGETTLTRENVGRLQLLWKYQTDAAPGNVNRYSTMTDPVVAENVPTPDGPRKNVFVASAENNVYAISAEKGTLLWKRSYPNPEKPPVAASGQCPNNLNATPVIDKQSGILYFLPNDGKLRGVSLSNGEDRFPATVVVPPYSRNFSLNLVDGTIYTSTTRGCGNATSEVVGINVAHPDHPVSHFYLSPGKASGVWGRGGIVRTPFGMLAQTADGAYDPASGRFGSTVVGLTKQVRLIDSFTPANQEELDARDLELGSSSPVVFPFGNRTLVATAGKESKIYLLDAKNLGGADHRTPLYRSERWANDAMAFGFNGMWSVMSTYVDAQGRRWLLAPMYGPPARNTVGLFKKSHGDVINGSLMAFTVESRDGRPYLAPQWISGDLDLPGVAVIANGVIFTLANGDRGATLIPGGGRGGRGGPGGPGGRPRTIPLAEVNPADPGFERDAAWRASQLRPFEEGGQKPGQRYSGGRDTTHAVLYALDPATGDELYASGDSIDSWNHYGGIALSGGNIYVSSYDARLFAFGLKK